MVSFADNLDKKDTDKIYNYVLQQAAIEYEKQQNQGFLKQLEFGFYDALAGFFIEAATGTTRFYVGIATFWTVIIGLFSLFRIGIQAANIHSYELLVHMTSQCEYWLICIDNYTFGICYNEGYWS